MKIFRGRKTKDVYVVELDNEIYMTILSLVKAYRSLTIRPKASSGDIRIAVPLSYPLLFYTK